MSWSGKSVAGLAVSALAMVMSGCVVGQPPGQGVCTYVSEANSGASYWLYLPTGYNRSPPAGQPRVKHPLVMTFHGMKPFDNADRQIKEWQQEADRYGFVVCAPDLSVSDLFGPLPLERAEDSSLQRDEKHVVAIMDEVTRTVDVDPQKVLATSWSYGGYVAHYLANRYPERFSCIAVKQSNFNAGLLNPAQVPRYRDHKVGVFFTENDFAICRQESEQAAQWYARHGFDVTYAMFEKKGHERTPGVAAEFFARTCGSEAQSPPLELALMQVKLLPPPGPSMSDMPTSAPFAPPRTAGGGELSGPQNPKLQKPGEPVPGSPPPPRPVTVSPPSPRLPISWPPPPQNPSALVFPPSTGSTPTGLVANDAARNRPPPPEYRPPQPAARSNNTISPLEPAVRVRVSSSIGVAPLLVSFSAVIPKWIESGAHFLWMVNGEPISNGTGGQKLFSRPGDHELGVIVTAANGREYRAGQVITVIERAAGREP